MTTLAGKTVLVTGAANGIGRAIASAAAAGGARLILGDLDGEALARAARELRAHGAEVSAQACDVRRLDELQSLVQEGSTGSPGLTWCLRTRASKGACASHGSTRTLISCASWT